MTPQNKLEEIMLYSPESYGLGFWANLWKMDKTEVTSIIKNPYLKMTPKMIEQVSYLTGRDDVEVYFACKYYKHGNVSATQLKKQRAMRVLGLL